jgi:hypothetical protein
VKYGKYGITLLPIFPNHFTIQLIFLPYFPYLFNIQLTFLLYFPYHFTFQLTFLPKDSENKEKGRVNSEMIWKIWKES